MSELDDEYFVSADNFSPAILDAAAANAANAAEAADVAMYATAATHAAAYANARERQWQFAPSVLSY
jgi:hypothetical protein